jgi:NAD(P)-dependent dehydrogenase (short-subunit alcohol dehydrogenase family)
LNDPRSLPGLHPCFNAGDVILDRLVHNVHRIEMRGDSMLKNRGNVRGNFQMARECGRSMVERKSSKVVNLASLHTGYSLAGMVPYDASKGAIGPDSSVPI